MSSPYSTPTSSLSTGQIAKMDYEIFDTSLFTGDQAIKVDSATTGDLKALIGRLQAQNAEMSAAKTELSAAIAAHESIHGGRVFTCFPRLPQELQDRIWSFSTTPRDIFLEATDWPVWIIKLHETVQPAISQVCQASRLFFLKEHFLLQNKPPRPVQWPGVHPHPVPVKKHHRPIYVNHIIDKIHVTTQYGNYPEKFISDIPRFLHMRIATCNRKNPHKWQIRNLTFEEDAVDYLLNNPCTIFDKFPALEHVAFLRYQNDLPYMEDPGDAPNVIRNPDPDAKHPYYIFDEEDDGLTEHADWESLTEEVGRLKRMRHYKKLAKVTVSVAICSYLGNYSERKVVDERKGLYMLGPPNLERLGGS